MCLIFPFSQPKMLTISLSMQLIWTKRRGQLVCNTTSIVVMMIFSYSVFYHFWMLKLFTMFNQALEFFIFRVDFFVPKMPKLFRSSLVLLKLQAKHKQCHCNVNWRYLGSTFRATDWPVLNTIYHCWYSNVPVRLFQFIIEFVYHLSQK